MHKTILLSGVGGQGTILVSKLLSEALLANGYDVKMSEIHGMSQRGGSVTTQIKYSKDKVYTSSIGDADADLIVAFEKLEATRYINQLKKDGTLLVNDIEILPLPVLSGYAEYPDNILEELENKVENLHVFNASEIATNLGQPRAQNIVMLGALVKALELEFIDWEEMIKGSLPEKFHDVNIKAFNEGLNL